MEESNLVFMCWDGFVRFLVRVWYFLYPMPNMFVDSTAVEYYHRSVERQLHWSERTDLKLQKNHPYFPCK